jgi:hypothetical protein
MTDGNEVAMFSLAYISTATSDMGDAELSTLLTKSRENNRHALLTGLLLYKDGRFLQFLEGPEASVREKMQVIASDKRHRSVAVLLEAEVQRRRFPQWTMGFQPVDDPMVETIPGFKTTFRAPARSSSAEAAIWDLIGWFQSQAEAH